MAAVWAAQARLLTRCIDLSEAVWLLRAAAGRTGSISSSSWPHQPRQPRLLQAAGGQAGAQAGWRVVDRFALPSPLTLLTSVLQAAEGGAAAQEIAPDTVQSLQHEIEVIKAKIAQEREKIKVMKMPAEQS